MTSSTGSAINARDFSKSVRDTNRDEWTSGAMHHLVKALKGQPVAIVLEKATGFTEVNVTLGGVRQTPGYGTFQVLVERVYSDGTTGGCWYSLFKVGTVIVLGDSNARWEALRSHDDEQSAAVCKFQKEFVAKLGAKDRYDLVQNHMPDGKWEASIFPGFVHVSYQPKKILGQPGFTWKRYESADLIGA